MGHDRNKDILKASTLTGTMITVGADVSTVPSNTEYNFTLNNVGLQVPLGKVLEASNIDKTINTGSIFGRTKVLQISNCEIRNTKDVWTIVGFELVDLLNTLVWFVTGTTTPIGCQFQSCRHIEISSCEVFNWSNSTATVSKMIEILPDVISTGGGTPNIFNAVVNMNGCIVHPEDDQVGLTISDTSETKFGTISANTFINVGLTGGSLSDIDYNIQNTYIIQANQGLQNGNAKISMQIADNDERLQTITGDPAIANPIVLKGANVITGAFTNPVTFPTEQRMIGTAADCSITYDTAIEGNFIISVNMVLLHTNGADTLATIQLRRNGVDMTDGYYQAQLKDDAEFPLAFSVLTTASITTPDVFDIEMSVRDKAPPYAIDSIKDVIVVSCVINAYQF
jgi:hypothetical protein